MTVPQRIVLATGNAHKVREVRQILDPYGISLLTPTDVGGLPEVVEDGETFAANAILKAESACRHTGGMWALADDSGIEAMALNGAPGVYSARYAGEPCDDQRNNSKLCAALRDIDDLRVRYVCVIALARPNQPPLTWDGYFEGRWHFEPRGSGGFGYDPHVWIEEEGCTVAELSDEAKHRRSHRGAALRACAEWLATQAT